MSKIHWPKYIESNSMKELNASLIEWLQDDGMGKEIFSLSIEKDDRGVFCCIALCQSS